VVEAVAERVGKLAAFGHLGEARFEPGLQRLNHGLGALLTDCAPHAGRQATDLGLDVVEQLDARERLGCDRCVAADIDLIELPPQVAPTIGERHRTARSCRRGQLLVGRIAVHLQDAVEAIEQPRRVLAAAAGRIGVGDRRRIGATPRPIVAGDRPHKAGLGLSRTGVEHGTARLVAEQPR